MLRGARSLLTLGCLILGAALLLTACGGGKVVGPLPKTVIGAVPKGPVVAAGNATAGKAVFNANGCGGCHAFKPAAATGAVGPALDSMAADASRAGVSLDSFIKASITDPGAFIAKGYADGIMPATFGQSLKPQELADLIAFLQQ